MTSSPSWRLRLFDELPSTSDHARDLARQGEPEGLAVMARRQTAGRGSRGRNWQTPAGNLALSLLLRPPGSARDMGQWALLAGLAVAQALDATPGGALSLKWPNDVLLNGAKLAGVLVDAEADAQGGIAWMVIGIGVNLAQAPEVPGRAVAVLDRPMRPDDLAMRILARVDGLRPLDFAAIRAEWLALAQPLGSPMTVRQPSREIAGHFAGLNADGNLLLRTPDGAIQTIIAGEIWTPGLKETLPC